MVLVLAVISRGAFAADLTRIVVLPFEIFSQSDYQTLEKQITTSFSIELLKSGHVQVLRKENFAELIEGKTIDTELARYVGEKTHADFVIKGSLTRLGDLISVDITVVDMERRTSVGGIYASGTGKGSIGVISADLVDQLLIKIFEKQRIETIAFAGSRRIEDNALRNVIKSEKGMIFSDRTLSEDIKALYKMGYFRDVTADVTEGEKGKIITFAFEEKPIIVSVVIQGNDDIDTDDIKEVLSIREKEILNHERVKSNIESIETLYRDKGYLNADVVYEIKERDGKSAEVIFTIVEHGKLYVETITFEGNKAFTDDELKDMMEISEKGFFSFFTDSGLLKKDTLEQDINKLNTFYHNNGYIKAQIGEPEITHDSDGIYVVIRVTEGKQFKVGNVEIAGDMLSVSRSELGEKLQINKKDYFDRESIMKDIDYLSEVCNNEGYAYASVVPRTISHEENEKVDVVYEIEKGNKIYFNRITITGNTRTRDKVIRRQLDVVEGDLYSGEKLKASYMKLSNLRYFEEVNFNTEKGPEENLTDITVEVKERSTGLFSIGAGYSSQENAIIMAQVQQRNLFGRGQTLSLNAKLSEESSRYEISFTEPWLFDRPLWSEFQFWNVDQEYDTYDLNTKGFKTTFGHRLFEHFTGYVGYEFKFDDVQNIADTASTIIKDQEGETTTSGVTVTLVRDTTNDWMFPTTGSKNNVSVEHTGTIFQGDTSFTRYTGTSTWFFPLPLDNVFALRGRIGYIHGNEGKEVPVYERFILGGMGSLRGLRDVGPVDPDTGDVIGGKTMMNFNVELVFPLIKDAGMKGVVFFDTGNTWESGYHYDDMRETAGVGIRWYSPIGPLRLEWGHVLDRKEEESASRWEFTIGMMM